MSLLIYLVTRLMMGLLALMAVDSLTGCAVAADPWHILSAAILIIIAEAMIEVNTVSKATTSKI